MPPLFKFFRLIETARLPLRADKSALGTMPTRAFRFCEAMRSASAFGWYIFPAMDFSLLWDSDDDSLLWKCDGSGDWQPLSNAVQFPGQVSAFDAIAPEDVRGFSPPWLVRLWEPGHVQIWSGLIAQTRPGTSLLVRPVANLPRSGGFEVYDGIVETDHWFGPLFTNIRIARSDRPIEFRADWPIAQVQPLPKQFYAELLQDEPEAALSMEEFTPGDWDAFRRTIVAPNLDPARPFGAYAAESRRAAKRVCPMASL